MINRICFAASALLAALVSAVGPTRAGGAEQAQRPNILLIMADDVGRETLGCYGGSSYRTPHLDALAASGTRFRHCYSMPVCHPSRLAIMAGRYPLRNPAGWGSWPAGITTFANVLQDAGYATAVAGKWQLALLKRKPDHAGLLGFDESALFGWHEGPRYHNPLIYRHAGEKGTGAFCRQRPEGCFAQNAPVPFSGIWEEVRKPEVYGPDVYTEFLIDFITRNKDRPFLAYYSMALCHEISDDFLPVPPPAPDGYYLTYKEMIEDMDERVGRLVAALDCLKLREKTLILFTTDNGSPRSYLTEVTYQNGKPRRHHKPVISMMAGQAVRGGKGTMTDAGTRVPLIANWPGTAPAGRVLDDLIDFSDFMPTLAELAQVRLSEGVHIDGRSFAPQLHGRPSKPRQWAFCEHRGRRWVRTHRWKLYNDGRLLDMDADPREKRPLAADRQPPEAAEARKQLQAALDSLPAGRQ